MQSKPLEDRIPEIPALTEGDLEQIPEGYHLSGKPNEGWGLFLDADDQSESFRITDRSFTEIDHYMKGKLEYHIQQLIDEREDPSVPIRILDLACGPRGIAADEIQSLFGDAVEVHGVDLLLSKPSARCADFGKRAQLTSADIQDRLPYPDHHFDFIYSFQFLPHLANRYTPSEAAGNLEKYQRCIAEVCRVLGRGSEAHLDDDLLCYYQFVSHDHPLGEILSQQCVINSCGYREQEIDGTMHTIGGPTPFLKLRKYTSVFV